MACTVLWETLYVEFQNAKSMFIKEVYFTSTVIQLKNYILKDPNTHMEELELKEIISYDLHLVVFLSFFFETGPLLLA